MRFHKREDINGSPHDIYKKKSKVFLSPDSPVKYDCSLKKNMEQKQLKGTTSTSSNENQNGLFRVPSFIKLKK